MARKLVRNISEFLRSCPAPCCFLLNFLLVTAFVFFIVNIETAARVTNTWQLTGVISVNLGLGQLIADIYEENKFLYAVITVIAMTTIGLALGFLVEYILKLLKLNLGKLERTE